MGFLNRKIAKQMTDIRNLLSEFGIVDEQKQDDLMNRLLKLLGVL